MNKNKNIDISTSTIPQGVWRPGVLVETSMFLFLIIHHKLIQRESSVQYYTHYFMIRINNPCTACPIPNPSPCTCPLVHAFPSIAAQHTHLRVALLPFGHISQLRLLLPASERYIQLKPYYYEHTAKTPQARLGHLGVQKCFSVYTKMLWSLPVKWLLLALWRGCLAGSLQTLDWNGGIVECVLQSKRSLLMQFFIMVTPVEVCNHDPEGSELHKQMPVWVVFISSILHQPSFFP